MSDTPPVESNKTPDAKPDDERLGDQGKKALEAERKLRRDAEARQHELQAKLDKIEAEELRRDVATSKGLTSALAKRLTGVTKEELEADADELLETFKGSAKEIRVMPGTRPTVELSGGGDPTQVPDDNPAAIADRIVGRSL